MAQVHDSEQPLVQNPPGWGSIQEVLAEPPQNVDGCESWASVVGFYVFLLFNIIAGAIGGLCQCAYRCYCVGTCCIPGSKACCSVLGMCLAGKGCFFSWIWWRANIAGLVALVANKSSRLALFLWEWEAFGKGAYWWHGEGVWTGTYAKCDELLKSAQVRGPAFGCINACVPDLFPDNLLIFLSNGGPESKWAIGRKLLHQFFLDQGMTAYKNRTGLLKEQVAAEWREPNLTATPAELSRMVSKCVFYVMFGVWVEDSEADMLSRWRSYATYFVLPRLIQRVAFNKLIKKVKALRADTVGLVEKYQKQEIFIEMSKKIPGYSQDAVALCDEMMFVIGFAGIGGTSALVESTAAFLQNKIPAESPGKDYIKWGQYDTSEKMIAKYKEDPEKYMKEVGRIDPPVTSATCTLKEEQDIPLGSETFKMPGTMLQQYCIGVANRDPELFPEPSEFDPDRAQLSKALTWNGAFGVVNDEKIYPRICPGRYLSLTIAKTIINNLINHVEPFAGVAGAAGACCGGKQAAK